MASSSPLPPAPPWSASSPARLLRFSPLAQSADGGASWVPAFLPGALSPVPDALAYESGSPGGAVALVSGDRALRGPIGLSSWSPLVTAATLSRVSPDCGVVGLDGATLLPGGAPLIATGCRRSGQIGLFTQTTASWHSAGFTLGGSLRRAATTVLRVQSTAEATTVLALVSRDGRRGLVALWRSGSAPWSVTRTAGSRLRDIRPVDRRERNGRHLPFSSAAPAAQVRPSRSRRQERGNDYPASRRGRRRWRCPLARSTRAHPMSMPSRWTASRSASTGSPLRARHG